MPGGSSLTHSLLRFRVKFAAPQGPRASHFNPGRSFSRHARDCYSHSVSESAKEGPAAASFSRKVTGTGSCGENITVACGVAGGGWTVRGQGPETVAGSGGGWWGAPGDRGCWPGQGFPHSPGREGQARVLTPPAHSNPADAGLRGRQRRPLGGEARADSVIR